jgi:hypothetical protein
VGLEKYFTIFSDFAKTGKRILVAPEEGYTLMGFTIPSPDRTGILSSPAEGQVVLPAQQSSKVKGLPQSLFYFLP